MVQFILNETQGRLHVRSKGSLTFDDHANAQSLVESASQSASDHVTLEIEALEAIDSAGVGILLFLNDRIGKLGKSFTIQKPAGMVKKVIELAKLREAIAIED